MCIIETLNPQLDSCDWAEPFRPLGPRMCRSYTVRTSKKPELEESPISVKSIARGRCAFPGEIRQHRTKNDASGENFSSTLFDQSDARFGKQDPTCETVLQLHELNSSVTGLAIIQFFVPFHFFLCLPLNKHTHIFSAIISMVRFMTNEPPHLSQNKIHKHPPLHPLFSLLC